MPPQMSDKDTEFTLTTGKILLLFFGLVILCGGFFGLGYSLGRNSTPLATNIGQPQTSSSPIKGGKPLSGLPVAGPTPCQGADCGDQGQIASATPPIASSTPQNPVVQPTFPSGTGVGTPEVVSPRQTGYIVQVAAVSRQEDAEVLVNALRKKNYPVFIATVTTDKLLHIQVGPFSDKNEAESMRSRLSADGYNAILK